MNFQFTEEQLELREMARAFLAEVSGSEQVRAAMDSVLGHDPAVWKRIGAELGWPAVVVPEAHGGLGLTAVELVALMEVMGETLLCAPFFATVCLGGQSILTLGSEEQKERWLASIAEGELTATLAHSEGHGGWGPNAVATIAAPDGDDILLTGAKRYVVDGHCADLVLVTARREGTAGEDGISLFAVPGDAEGLARQKVPTMDQTRSLAEIRLDRVRVSAAARLGGDGDAWPGVQRALDLAAVALAAEQVGGAQRCLDDAVAYAKERVQFGKPIGQFQAIKHKCADMMVKVEAARSAVYTAACVAAEGGADLGLAASSAKATASDAYFFVAGCAIQIFGGVGMTWEYDTHLYFKRAQASEKLLGDPAYHRERVAREIGL